MSQQLAFKDPTGRVYIMDEAEALPPLAEGFEWTVVVRPDQVMTEEPEPEYEPAPRRGFLDIVVPIFTPRADQTPQERAQELIDAIPADARTKLAQLFRALVPRQPPDLPPFPGVGQ